MFYMGHLYIIEIYKAKASQRGMSECRKRKTKENSAIAEDIFLRNIMERCYRELERMAGSPISNILHSLALAKHLEARSWQDGQNRCRYERGPRPNSAMPRLA